MRSLGSSRRGNELSEIRTWIHGSFHRILGFLGKIRVYTHIYIYIPASGGSSTWNKLDEFHLWIYREENMALLTGYCASFGRISIYMYTCICLYICMYTDTHIPHICMYIYIYIYMHIYTRILHICIYIYMCIYKYTYICIHIYMDVFRYIYICINYVECREFRPRDWVGCLLFWRVHIPLDF